MNLDEIRKQIDEIDGQILELFCRRMNLVKEVAAYKIENGLPVLRPEREQSILENVSNRAGAEYGLYAAELFRCLMEVSREMQTQIMEEYENSAGIVPTDSAAPEGSSGLQHQKAQDECCSGEQRGQEQ